MELEKRSGETDFEYHKRLICGKLIDKTFADIDYSELSEIVYGKPYSSDVARRMMYGSKYTIDLIERSDRSQLPSEALSDIDEKIIELQKERRRIFESYFFRCKMGSLKRCYKIFRRNITATGLYDRSE